MLEYIQLSDNPFLVTPETEKQLHNIIPHEEIKPEVKESMFSVELKGPHLYNVLRKERVKEKTRKLSETVHRNNIKTFQSTNAVKSSVTATKKKVNEAAAGHIILEIAQASGCNTKHLFKYNLIPTSYLFDEDEPMKKIQLRVPYAMHWRKV